MPPPLPPGLKVTATGRLRIAFPSDNLPTASQTVSLDLHFSHDLRAVMLGQGWPTIKLSDSAPLKPATKRLTVSLSDKGLGAFHPYTGAITLPITLRLDYDPDSFVEKRDQDVQLTLATHSPGSPLWRAGSYLALDGQATYTTGGFFVGWRQHICRVNLDLSVSPLPLPIRYDAVWRPQADNQTIVDGWQTPMSVSGGGLAISAESFWNKYHTLKAGGWRLGLLNTYPIGHSEIWHIGVCHVGTDPEIDVSRRSYQEFRAKYGELWSQGWRLKLLTAYVVASEVQYTAVWHRSTEGEIQVYGWRYADFRAKYDALWGQGWRLKILAPYVLNGEIYYTAVWRPSNEAEIQVYGWRYSDFKAKYDALWPDGWRLKLLSTYLLNGERLYTAVWRPDNEGEIQFYDLPYAALLAKHEELLAQGWRLKLLAAS